MYTYDTAGNILTKKTYALTAAGSSPSGLQSTYSYGYASSGWKDEMTSYRGHSVTYDAVGNPLQYYNGYNYTFTWSNGRNLSTASTDNGTHVLSFSYDDNGLRTTKTVDGIEHEYRWNGTQLVSESFGNTLLLYLYDADGTPICMQYRTSSMAEGTFYTYWYEKDLQGNVTAVYNSTGTKLISYTYDAWGNTTKTVHNSSGTNAYASYNPFTYRGYYYDSETGFYYLQSRYYDPAIGRFLNADTSINANGDLLGFNMFAYCGNNPVNCFDPTGEFVLTALIVGAIVGAVIGFAATAYVDYKDDGKIFNGSIGAKKYVANTIVGGIIGGVTGGVGGSTFSLTIPTVQAALTTTGSTVLVAGTTTITVTGLQVIAVGTATAGILYFSNRSDKEKSTDKPSWVNTGMVDPQKSAQQNATNILNNKYGPGKWKSGANSEYNKIVKWITRKVFFYGK